MTIQLTTITRLSLDAILGAQKGTLSELMTFHDIKQKLCVNRELREKCVKTSGANVFLDLEAMAAVDPVEVTLEKEEVRKLRDLMRSWPHFAESDVEWAGALQKELDKAA